MCRCLILILMFGLMMLLFGLGGLDGLGHLVGVVLGVGGRVGGRVVRGLVWCVVDLLGCPNVRLSVGVRAGVSMCFRLSPPVLVTVRSMDCRDLVLLVCPSSVTLVKMLIPLGVRNWDVLMDRQECMVLLTALLRFPRVLPSLDGTIYIPPVSFLVSPGSTRRHRQVSSFRLGLVVRTVLNIAATVRVLFLVCSTVVR